MPLLVLVWDASAVTFGLRVEYWLVWRNLELLPPAGLDVVRRAMQPGQCFYGIWKQAEQGSKLSVVLGGISVV